jgi:hypothetical protein
MTSVEHLILSAYLARERVNDESITLDRLRAISNSENHLETQT